LQLRPDEFWRLLPREFELLWAGFKRREDRAWEKIATLGIWVLAPYSKKSFTPAQLLGRARLETRPAAAPSAEDEQAAIELERARVLHEAMQWAKGD
jgi:hypothetical protein